MYLVLKESNKNGTPWIVLYMESESESESESKMRYWNLYIMFLEISTE